VVLEVEVDEACELLELIDDVAVDSRATSCHSRRQPALFSKS
jgi:hypothetical protein